MNLTHPIYCLCLLFSVLISPNLHAQKSFLDKEITTWYLEERFLIADQNDDALLDKSEMEVFEKEFIYYLTDRNFTLADKNRDGFLSYNEINQKKKSENIYRFAQERKHLRELGRKHPLLRQADESYLKRNPDLVIELFTNLTWMYENVDIAEKVYDDKMWTSRNPAALIALHNNLRWMAANPMEAKNLYRDHNSTKNLPHLLGWRADHKDFIRSHSLSKRFYDVEFIPSGIRIDR